jgi:putative phage-type endonuclease
MAETKELPVTGPMAYTKEWYEARKKTIGASESSKVLGMSRYGQALDVFIEKKKDPSDHDPMTDAMRRGHALEPACLSMYQQRVGGTLYMDCPMLIHPKHTFLSCTPDALWCPDEINLKKLPWSFALDYIPVEAKTSEMYAEWGEEGTDAIPNEYLIQCQQHMAVTETERCDVPVWVGLEHRVYVVPRDDSIIDAIIDASADMMQRVEADNPPPVDWEHPKTPEIISKLHSVREGVVINLADELVEKWMQVEDLRKQKRELEAKEKLLKAEVEYAMGDANIARMPNGREIVRSIQKRSEYTVAAREFITMRARKIK